MALISRRDWGARAPRGPYTSLTHTKGVKVHYIGDHVDPRLLTDHDRCLAVMRQIQNHHMDGNGWTDFAYNLAVCPHGDLLMGRGAGHMSAANGPGRNHDHYAVLGMLGSTGLTDPTDAMLNGIRDAIDYLREHGGAGKEIKGHRDGYSTSCPGAALYAWVKAGAPRPDGGSSSPSTTWTETLVDQLPLLSPGATGRHVKTCFYLLRARGYGKELDEHVIDPTVYGPAVVAEVKRFQAEKGLDDDGLVGKATWPRLLGL
ncbi:peptidoglycan-binding protein [Streptosporangium sp. NPDC051022]|uniref:peptidoglycan recognition protein family protein n=1 Tax=Streptosporangium sp. NPDC051022 TaxID=3155752 RepID=UPI003423EBF5